MANPSKNRQRNGGLVRLSLIIVGLILVVYIWRPYFSGSHSHKPKKKLKTLLSCPKCSCDCPKSDVYTLSSDIFNMSSQGCTSEDPQMNEELKKDLPTLIAEEISLQKNVTRDNVERAQELLTDARRTSSLHLREAKKCYVRVDTCEIARQRAEADLLKEHKLTALWEERAHKVGWRD